MLKSRFSVAFILDGLNPPRMSSPRNPPATPAKTLSATGPILVVILVLVAAILGYYQIVYYPANAVSSNTTASTTSIPETPVKVVVSIPSGAVSPGHPTSFYYAPDVITVLIGYNSTVVWVNNDSSVHTVTADGTPPDPRFSQFGPAAPASAWNNVYPKGQGTPTSVNFTFTIPGTYNYSCSYHVWMKGEVIVKAGTANASGQSSADIRSSLAVVPPLVSDPVSTTSYLLSSLHSAAALFTSSLATLTGSGIEPWSVNLSSSLTASASEIPADLM